MFFVPSCSAEKAFIDELTRHYEAFALESALEGIAFKAAMTATILLQESLAKSKSKKHSLCLED